MAVMTQEQMEQLVRGGTICDDSSMDVQLGYITGIALAALGDDIEALRKELKPYADDLEELVNRSNFFTQQGKDTAVAHIAWLRSL